MTTAGTTSERILKAMNADKQMGMNVISAKDHGESFQMLETRPRRRLHDGRRPAGR